MSIFNSIKLRRPKRSPHNLSFSSQLSTRFGDLTPMYLEKVYPGDSFKHSHEYLIRFAPFRNQVFQNFQVRTEYFFVPSRIIWDNFPDFLASAGLQTEEQPVHPYVDLAMIYNIANTLEVDLTSSILDYLGLPTGDDANSIIDPTELVGDESKLHVDALPFYAYIWCFLAYYADENFDYESLIKSFDNIHDRLVDDGDQTVPVLQMLGKIHGLADTWINDPTAQDFALALSPFIRSYPKDYFTSALPFAQRGPVVQIPLNGSGDVEVFTTAQGGRMRYQDVFAEFSAGSTSQEVAVTLRRGGDLGVLNDTYTTPVMVDGQATGSRKASISFSDSNASQSGYVNALKDAPEITFKAVNVNGTATITDLRTAMTVQGWLEKNARAGVRPNEMIASHFGIGSKDYRLQRPEFIQRTKGVISIGEVFTTAADDADTFVAGMGVSTATGSERSKVWKFKVPEHGYIIGLISVFPTAAYFQGIRRQWMELDAFDYYWPEFQNIGEQPIYNAELALCDDSEPKGIFGYTPRYAHYKTHTNEVHGDFRKSLNFMVDARRFGSQPTLNNDFVQIKPAKNGLNRVFNVVEPLTDHAPIYIHMFHSVRALRPMQYFGNPRII